jgi:hypothetical protein
VTPATPNNPQKRNTDKEPQQQRTVPAEVPTPVDPDPKQWLAIRLHDLLAARQPLGGDPLCPPTSVRRVRRRPRTQRHEQDYQGQQDPDGKSRRAHPHTARPYPSRAHADTIT